MNIKLTLLLFFCCSISLTSFAQQDDFLIPGEMVIQFESEKDFQRFSNQNHPNLQFVKNVSENLQLYLYTYDPVAINSEDLTQTLNQQTLVKAAGQNFYMERRATIPNDEFFNNQVSFDLIKAPEAWDITTSAPEEVVVAIVEGGDINHEDLRDNIWTNPGETPNDGMDNDNNGYVDDYFGVNVTDSTDTPIIDDHGTAVAGIVGAKGDNSIGVAGIMWDINLMIVSSNLTYVNIIESYEYVYKMRKRYNDTNGATGAKIVATNSSFGRGLFPDQHPLFPTWCDAYDLMGSVGVLSIAATSNSNNYNVELGGDMPSLCESDYLIMVTNTNLEDELVAGFSLNYVDLSAPGRCYTTDPFDQYGNFTGTSASTPVVTGAVAMMYSYPCEAFQVQSIQEPALTALQVKRILLENVDPIFELSDKTVSGGRLNLFQTMQALQGEYGAPKGELGFIKIYPNPVHETLSVEYQTSEISEYDLKVYDALGRLVYQEIIPEICADQVIDIPVLSLASGTYFMSIENANNIKSTKFVVY